VDGAASSVGVGLIIVSLVCAITFQLMLAYRQTDGRHAIARPRFAL